MKKRKSFIIENIIKFCVAIGIIIILTNIINSIQNGISRRHQYNDSIGILEKVSDTLAANEVTAAELTEVYHKGNREILDDLIMLMQTDSARHVFDEATDDSMMLDGLIAEDFAPYLFLTDDLGNVTMSVDAEYIGQNLCNIGFFTKNQLDELFECTPEGIVCVPLDAKNDYSFYAAAMTIDSKPYYLIIGNDNDVFQERINSLMSLKNIVNNVSLNDSDFIFSIDNTDGKIIYCSRDEMGLEGKTAAQAGIPQSLLKNRASATIKINGTEYFCAAVNHKDTSDNIILIQAVSTEVRYNDNYKPTVWAIVLLIMTLIIAVHYELMLPSSRLLKKKPQLLLHIFRTKLVINLSALSKALPLLVLGLTLIFGCVFYARTITKLSWAINDVKRPMDQLIIELKENDDETKAIDDYSDQMYISKAQMIANMLEIDPSCLNEETEKVYTEYSASGLKSQLLDSEGNPMYSVANSISLDKLCTDNDLESIKIFNDRGYTIASSDDNWYFQLKHDPEDPSYMYFDVLDGRYDYFVSEEDGKADDDEDDDEENKNLYIAVSFHYYTSPDDDGSTLYVSRLDYDNYLNGKWNKNPITKHQSLMLCAVDMSVVNKMMESLNLSYIMEHVSLTNNAYMVVFDNSADHKILYTPNTKNIGKTAKELNISDAEFSGTFNGFQTVEGIEYFECCRYNSGYYIAIATPLSSLYSTRLTIALIITFSCLIACILIMLLFSITGEETMIALQNMFESDTPVPEQSLSGEKTVSGLKEKFLKWDHNLWHMSVEEKLANMIRFFAMLIGIYFMVGFLCDGELFIDNSLIEYVFSDSWERGINIFAFTKSFIILVAVIAAVEILSWFVKVAFTVFNSSTITIAHLLLSCIRYGSVIGALFYIFYLFGMQPAALLASAGGITLIIGLGAQSLIGDMLAGIFIIFEHSFRVGDLVCVNGSYGFIKEIGIRTTKMQDLNNYIVVCSNSSIKDIVNLSVKVIRLRMTFSISYKESIERVEEIFRKELPLFKDKIPQILDAPRYRGIHDLGPSSIDLKIYVNCNGRDYFTVLAGMNREILLLFKKYNIEIPYQHITIVKDSDTAGNSDMVSVPDIVSVQDTDIFSVQKTAVMSGQNADEASEQSTT